VDEVLRAGRRLLREPVLRVLLEAEVRRREEEDDAVLRRLRALDEADLDLLDADFERLPLVFDFDRLADLLRVRDVAERCLARLRPELDGIWQSPLYLSLRCFSRR
jgi:hypothetical protein